MQVGVACTAFCDGQTVGSPGRWPPSQRRYPTNDLWTMVAGLLMDFARQACTTDVLTRLALGRVDSCPFNVEEIRGLRKQIVQGLTNRGLHLNRNPHDRSDVPVSASSKSSQLPTQR